MNGEVNGTMDKPIEASAPSPPDNLQDEKQDVSEGCDNATTHCENSNNTEDSNHLDSENSQECIAICNPENSENDISNGSDSQKLVIKLSTTVSEHEISNNTYLENNSGNSNESYPESVNSSHTIFETTEQIIIHNIDEKIDDKDELPVRKFTTGTTSITHISQIDENSDDIDTDDSSVYEGEPRAEDTVSIHSDSDPDGDLSQEGVLSIKRHNIIILENEGSSSVNENSHGTPSPEVQEILSDNDDCILADDKSNTNDSDMKIQLRRSSRAIKRKRYNDDMENGDGDHGSNTDELPINANFLRKTNPIVINDTTVLADMAERQIKTSQYDNEKSEPTVVIIDTMASVTSEKPVAPRKLAAVPTGPEISSQNYYKSLQLRGTTVTPISSKSNAATQSSQTPQPSILPSLTDDMFVVEAPSFIVPYVYEKPSIKPFREFVDLLGKELDEKKAKEEKEKERKEKEKKDKLEKIEKGEDVEDVDEEASSHAASEPEASDPVEEKKKKKKEKRRRGDEDDASWDGETSTDSDDEILMSDEEDKTIIIKDKVDSIQEIKGVADVTADKVSSTKSDNYFDCSLGKFFINIGLSLVQEYVQSDLLKQQNRKLNREKKTGVNTKSTESSIASLMKNLELSKETNVPYSFPQKKCEFCSFKTESKLALTHHLETPHMKNNVYKCNFCAFEIRSPHDILFHMEAEHNIRGRLERAPAYHQCANCPFEDNGKGKLARHLIPCAKKFKPELNLAPPLEWEPPAKIPKIPRSRNNMLGSYQNTLNRNSVGNNVGRPALYVSNAMPGVSSTYRPRGRTPVALAPRAVPAHGTPALRGGVMVRQNAPVLMSSNFPATNNVKQKSVHQPSISITPLPRQPQPAQQPQPSHNSKSTFVICEICDGYIKDLDQLRNHMQWIHKVKIHPKMIYNRPPLNCQKCQFRFFTDQGLERHLLGSHGLVTSSMQEAANKGKDSGRCPVCGRVYQWMLLIHVAKDHNLKLKPAHLSYKCTVCTATFGMYKQFENHVYSAHSVVAKRVMDKSKGAAPVKTNRESLLKPLKINEEITIIPQPVKAAPTPVDDQK